MSPKRRRQIRTLPVQESSKAKKAEGGLEGGLAGRPAAQAAGPVPSEASRTFWQRHWISGLSVLIGLTFFVLYIITTSRSVATGDSGELVAAAWILGVAHQPGYPTFTILSHLAGLLPFGNPAFRMNLLSAVLDAAAVGILSWGMLRFLRSEMDNLKNKLYWLVPVAGAVAGAGLLGVSKVFWLYSTVAEVFALNNLFAAITLVFMLEWVRRPGRNKFLYLSGLFAGIAMTNQLTFILLMPGLLTLMVGGIVRWRNEVLSVAGQTKHKKDPGWRLGNVGIALGLFILGFLPYIYLPVAAQTNPAINWGNPVDFNRFWQVLTRADYGTFSFTANATTGNPFQQLYYMGRYFLDGFSIAGVLLALLGMVWFARKRRLEGAGLGLAFLLSGPIFAMVANPQLDVALTRGVFERFYILPSIPLAFFVAGGAFYVIELAEKAAHRIKAGLAPQAAVLVGMVGASALIIAVGAVHYPTISLSNNRIVENYGKDVLEPLEPDALLLMTQDYNGSAILYAQLVEGVRPDVIALHAELLKAPWYVYEQRRLHPEITIPFDYLGQDPKITLADLIKANIGQRPVYGSGVFSEDLSKSYDVPFWGLACKFVQKGSTTDTFALMKTEGDRFINLHYPDKVYPATYWENVMAEIYGQTAFIIAVTRSQPEAQPDAAFVEKMYRIALLNNPVNPSGYKNLGILLWKNGGSPAEIIRLWEKYLLMVPGDPDNESIRQVLEKLKAQP